MADELKDMEYADIRAALSGASTEKAPAAEPVVEEKVETPPVEGEQTPPAEVEGEKAPAEQESRKEKRFSKITKERDQERSQRMALEARLAALEAAQAGKSAPQQPAPVEADAKPSKPALDNYATWDEYQKALGDYEDKVTDWKVAQALAKKEREVETARQKADYDRVHGNWQKQIDDLTEENDDLEDAIKTVGESVAKKGIIDVIKESDIGAKMVLYLHRNPEELKKVEGMSIASAARYLGKIEARIEGEVAATSSAAKPAKTLPKPPAQVGGAPAGASKAFDYQKASDAEFKEQLRREGIFRPRR